MEQPPGFVAQGESGLVCKLRRSLYGLKQSPRAWFGKFSQVVQNFGMTRSEADHSIFYCHSSSAKCVYLVVYVDDIVITGNDDIKISQLKQYLFSHFQTKDLGHLKYFLGIEVAQSKEGIVISQRKYALDILQETSMSNCKPVYSLMDPNMKLMFMMAPCVDHWTTVLRILKYIQKTPGQGSPIDRRSTTGFCISIGGNMVSWKSKKQNIIARSSAEAEYRAMASATCELIWVKQLIQELKFTDVQPMKLYCDNQATLHIASNPVFLERTKHIEIDCHFIWEKLLAKEISTEFINSSNQLADIFTKSLRGPQIQTDREGTSQEPPSEVKRSVESEDKIILPYQEEIETVNIGSEEEVKEVKVGLAMCSDDRNQLVQLLTEYIDIFAWSYRDMPRLGNEIVEHKIPLELNYPPVKQKLRRMSPETSLKIKEEVKKQLEAEFLTVAKSQKG
ncbi:Copia protein, partial [Mucuna pruriens]